VNVGIFLPNWLGDVAMATPLLRAMRRRFARPARLVGILRPYLADVLAGTDWLDEQWLFDPRAKNVDVRLFALVRRMRRQRMDMAVLLSNSFHTALAAWLGGASRRIGYARQWRGVLLTHRLRPPRQGLWRVKPSPMVDYYLKLAEAVGCEPEEPRLELATTESDRQKADDVWRRLGLRTDGRVVLLNSSGAYGGAKLWPVEHFALLARRIADRLDHDVLVLCGPNERRIARDIVQLAERPRVMSMAEQPMDLGTAKACIERGRLIISTDSGPRHVAAALGKPAITLFGPILPIWSENPTQRAVNLVLDLDCIGCHQRVCPLGHHDCMRKLTVDMVYAEVLKLLEERTSAAARAERAAAGSGEILGPMGSRP
jgi:heptosyltransferase-2